MDILLFITTHTHPLTMPHLTSPAYPTLCLYHRIFLLSLFFFLISIYLHTFSSFIYLKTKHATLWWLQFMDCCILMNLLRSTLAHIRCESSFPHI
ncbi:hypothetical protein BCR43DRAFT_302257 [Syncephalastrum racemosum]|uniref:Uncharacterized protein n=1 Tax=Syncephalastrum racemosum TaxID=13706 RepID=A0A1X2H9Y7_SYNRA|nr:hypothetical protein BCR43DRAFT_302257 [Syncephalastrum racemosum]